jgi:hypothetical protein
MRSSPASSAGSHQLYLPNSATVAGTSSVTVGELKAKAREGS